MQLLAAEEEPLHDEHSRRPWSRFFLVTGGHIHSSMYCSTCNRNGKATAFSWLPDLSGLTEEEAVAAHGRDSLHDVLPLGASRMDGLLRAGAERKAATYCAGSGTSDWKDGKVRNGFYSATAATAGTVTAGRALPSRYSSTIRKHKPSAAQ